MWEEPDRIDVSELTRIGEGEHDDWDSLERAQWKKFAHAADFLAPQRGETVIDVGCGYPGFLQVMMDRHPDVGKVVGWTHSANQVHEGQEMLSRYDPKKFELNEGTIARTLGSTITSIRPGWSRTLDHREKTVALRTTYNTFVATSTREGVTYTTP